jgi:hypothetical protein
MKSSRAARCLLAAALVCFSARAAELKQITAELKLITGPQNQVTLNGEYIPSEKGKTIREGSTLVTGPGSTAAFVIKEQKTVIRLQTNGTMSFDRMLAHSGGDGQANQIMFDLKQGRLVASAERISAADKFEIKSAKGVIGIRGANFATDSASVTHCRKGVIVAIYVIGGVAAAPVYLKVGQTLTPPITPGAVPFVYPTPPDIAAALDKEIKELKKLAGYR